MKTYIDNYHGKDWKNWYKKRFEIPIGDLDYYVGGYKYSDERVMWHELTKNHLKWFQRKVRKIYAAAFNTSIEYYTDLHLSELEKVSLYYISPRDFINLFNFINNICYNGSYADTVFRKKSK